MAKNSANLKDAVREEETGKLVKKRDFTKSNADRCEFKFVWEFKDFYQKLHAFERRIRSREFCLQAFDSSSFCFDFYPSGKTQVQKDQYASLYLIQSVPHTIKDMRFSCSLEKEDFNKSQLPATSISAVLLIHSVNEAWLYPCRSLTDSNFKLVIQIYFAKGPFPAASRNENLCELSNDVLRAYEESLHYDMVTNADDEEFKVHRAVIKARFPQLWSVKFIDRRVKKDVFEKLLIYIYSGKLDRKDIPIGFYDVLSIYRKSKMQSFLFSDHKMITAETCYGTKDISFTWKIENFSDLEPGETLRYLFLTDDQATWTWFKIFFKVVGQEEMDSSKGNIVIWLQRYSELCKFVVCNLSIAEEKISFTAMFGSRNSFNIPSFVSKETLLSLPNDELTIDFRMRVLDGSCTSHIKTTLIHTRVIDSASRVVYDLGVFQKDMEQLLSDPEDCDLKLMSGSESLPVHKFILCARSPVFRKVIEESLTKPEIAIEFDAAVVKSMLRFMYCAEVDLGDLEHAAGLYCAANRYEIPGLIRLCASDMKSRLTPENSLRILLIADAYSDEVLINLIIDYICSNSISVMRSSEWSNIKGRTDLVMRMLETALRRLGGEKQ